MSFKNRLAYAAAVVCFALVGPMAEAKFANDEDTYTFAGVCPNGETYRIYAYQKLVENTPQSFYDYQGPVGKGTVRSTATPKTMAARVCRQSAEIVNANYWE
jgi:hypothetical protein